MSFPSPIIAVLAHFQPLFTAPTWRKVVMLLVGTLLARGRRTVTAALRQVGQQSNANFSNFHHVLNRARWSALEVSRRLLQVLISTFVGEGTIDIVIDETLERHWVCLSREKGLIPKLSEFACFVFRPEEHRQENGLTDERKAISPG